MANRHQRGLQKASEQTRAEGAEQLGVASPPPFGPLPTTRREIQAYLRREAATMCGWCGGPILLKAKGRIPKWCSPSCRQRAWEQSRAAASGLAAVRVVERRVQSVEGRASAPVLPEKPHHLEWTGLLRELGSQLDTGAIYDRDLSQLTAALNDVLDAFNRRTHPTGRMTRRPPQ